ncbi:MAG: hypothetical protein KA140_00710 [Caldisericia bacterium]|nr:hypothetical protein [Caldisericia bacterium]
MKKVFALTIIALMLIQLVPMASTATALSKADFAPKRRALCEIFVEPN